ncbi:hypothetical protein PORY_000691 [Pneumocystis oryctolagi]|uniref:Uncharacterized protein n=1 Tax=Pneumocystis oryctolagi TaxID=42067 RepID=A0ACB7CDQ3_9ASCO|nr:hypothetical protein PORY_000691 [Pneumocystis oryctolagi]
MTNTKKMAIIGGGPVGVLSALFFGRDGWEIELYEQRDDLSNPLNKDFSIRKSINLALSERGIQSLRCLGLDEIILDNTVPMYGRMVHHKQGKQEFHKYDVHGNYINSINRNILVMKLFNEVKKFSNIKLFFNCKVVNCDIDTGTVFFKKIDYNTDELFKTTVDLIVGCDGVYSIVRQSLERKTTINFEKKYVDRLKSMWCEFSIPAIIKNDKACYSIDPNCLHVWPRKTFMLIALPNQDKTFTCTLFMPKAMFEEVKTESNLLELFNENFPDAKDLIGSEELVKQFFHNPKSHLVTIKCNPYFYKSKCVVLGDAAHCMLPFYGQGMNCGFEDVKILNQFINSNPTNIEKALMDYSDTRHIDAITICDLTLHNWEDMRLSIISREYLIRKKIEDFLYLRLPFLGIVPLYTMISFSNIRYSLALKKWERQKKILNFLIYTGEIGICVSIIYLITQVMLGSIKILNNPSINKFFIS